MTDGADGNDMLALVRQIHDGVYDYQKHQDDRVGRFLTALAFLGSGALVVALGGTVRNVRYSFDHDQLRVPLPGVFLIGFFTLLGLGLLLLVVSIGPHFVLGERREKSLLFAFAIADHTRDEWEGNWQPANQATL